MGLKQGTDGRQCGGCSVTTCLQVLLKMFVIVPRRGGKMRMDDHIGGGFLFLASSPSSTQIWFADDWLATLRPVVRFAQGVFDVIPGFDWLRAHGDLNGG